VVTRIKELGAELSRRRKSEGHPPPEAHTDTPKETLKARLDDRERLLHMAERGEIRLGSGKIPDSFWDMPQPEDPEGEVMQALLDERESAR
jgi:hypothetical protein